MIDCGTNWVRFLASGHVVKALLSVEVTSVPSGILGQTWIV